MPGGFDPDSICAFDFDSGSAFCSWASPPWREAVSITSSAARELKFSTLGFRLRSIPSEKIREYAVQDWNPLYGYGIRGLGERRAYVWGNRGVRIKTSDGEVFLGHSNPDRIVHDLDVIKQFASVHS